MRWNLTCACLLALFVGMTAACHGGATPAEQYDSIVQRRSSISSTIEYHIVGDTSSAVLTIRFDHNRRTRVDYARTGSERQDATHRTILSEGDDGYICVSPYKPDPTLGGACASLPSAKGEKPSNTSAERGLVVARQPGRTIAGHATKCFELMHRSDPSRKFTECADEHGDILHADGDTAYAFANVRNTDITSTGVRSTAADPSNNVSIDAVSVEESVDDSAFTPPYPVIKAAALLP